MGKAQAALGCSKTQVFLLFPCLGTLLHECIHSKTLHFQIWGVLYWLKTDTSTELTELASQESRNGSLWVPRRTPESQSNWLLRCCARGFLSARHRLISPGKKNFNWENTSNRLPCGQICGIFSLITDMGETSLLRTGLSPAGSPQLHNKADWKGIWRKPVSSSPLWPLLCSYLQASALSSCPDFTSWWTARWNKSFPSQGAFVLDAYHPKEPKLR